MLGRVDASVSTFRYRPRLRDIINIRQAQELRTRQLLATAKKWCWTWR
jgi:hypothetical protein